MERAGNEELTEDTEKKGLGTPATRAAIIEKLIQSGFVKREKKNLVPTDDGNVLITVLPDEIKSPKMTAEWEMALNHIAQNTETADEFLNGITELMQELVARYQGISEEKKNQFQGKAKGEVIGKCPRCGADVREGKVNFYCSDRKCAFTLWKMINFLQAREKRWIRWQQRSSCLKEKSIIRIWYQEKQGDSMKQLWRWSIPEREMYSSILFFHNDK